MDLQGAVEEFCSIVTTWPGKSAGMKCTVRLQKAPSPSSPSEVSDSAPALAAEVEAPAVGDKRKGRKGAGVGTRVEAGAGLPER